MRIESTLGCHADFQRALNFIDTTLLLYLLMSFLYLLKKVFISKHYFLQFQSDIYYRFVTYHNTILLGKRYFTSLFQTLINYDCILTNTSKVF